MNSTADDEMNQSQNEVSQTTKRPKKESDDNGMGKTAVTSSVNVCNLIYILHLLNN